MFEEAPEKSDAAPGPEGQYGSQTGVVGGADLLDTLQQIEAAHPESAKAPGTAQAAIEAINTATATGQPKRSILDLLLRRNKPAAK